MFHLRQLLIARVLRERVFSFLVVKNRIHFLEFLILIALRIRKNFYFLVFSLLTVKFGNEFTKRVSKWLGRCILNDFKHLTCPFNYILLIRRHPKMLFWLEDIWFPKQFNDSGLWRQNSQHLASNLSVMSWRCIEDMDRFIRCSAEDQKDMPLFWKSCCWTGLGRLWIFG